ncbi:NlpC/P60 family protein [Mycobacteroides immunogenum]|uniref:Invasion protein n=1 Tax=Mycobacteroides immunogenum TaxID=83262 RepID=A0A0N1CJ46_9MYCO|nr:NlpC/P60 family protein [Mycobacteroides immunogenum]AMT71348.1 invasion protein [Mycobacteroides immunogenum]ANO04459.1 invasion protein [Mycobacteroides immunogenum]KIU42459.1 invasion protein [Mycobacteroides immunogenum]KPG14953.1 invasion protein [Mycobacteroides immunogenum]KPG15569.1 invasion protein [Mycobacteroides immunogenum]
MEQTVPQSFADRFAVRGKRTVATALAVPPLMVAGLMMFPGTVAVTSAEPNDMASLITQLADTNQQIEQLTADVQTQQESINKGLVDLQDARDNAASAAAQVAEGQRAVDAANDAIGDAQGKFDRMAAATYMAGPSTSYLTATNPDDVVRLASVTKSVEASSQTVMDNLRRARTEQVNKQSQARAIQEKADQAATDAQQQQDDLVSAMKDVQTKLEAQRGVAADLTAKKKSAEAQLAAARGPAYAASTATVRVINPSAAIAGNGNEWTEGPAPAAGGGEWDTTLPMIASANVPTDPTQTINMVLGIGNTAANVGQSAVCGVIGIFCPKAAPAAAPSGEGGEYLPKVYGRENVERVIARAGSAMGTPYSWGGGSYNGPTRGIDSGAGTVGYDCSGLMMYGFAAVGIRMRHYTGYQYNSGRKVPSAEMKRGDMIFYGPNASQHVALYLGNGQMLEAPNTGDVVKVSPVRTSGMTPYVTRMIEW